MFSSCFPAAVSRARRLLSVADSLRLLSSPQCHRSSCFTTAAAHLRYIHLLSTSPRAFSIKAAARTADTSVPSPPPPPFQLPLSSPPSSPSSSSSFPSPNGSHSPTFPPILSSSDLDDLPTPSPALFQPLIGSILQYLDFRQQQQQQQQHPVVHPAPNTSQPATITRSAPHLSPSSIPTIPFVLDYSDPAIRHLFPVLPLPRRPPKILVPPFPTRPTKSSPSPSARTALHLHLLHCATADHCFQAWLVTNIGTRYYSLPREQFDEWMADMSNSRAKELQLRAKREAELVARTLIEQAGEQTGRGKERAPRSKQMLERMCQRAVLLEQITHASAIVMRQERRREAAAARDDARELKSTYYVSWHYQSQVIAACRLWGMTLSPRVRAEKIIAAAKRGEAFERTAFPDFAAVDAAYRRHKEKLMTAMQEEQLEWWHEWDVKQRKAREEKSVRAKHERQESKRWRMGHAIDHSRPPADFAQLLSYYHAPPSPLFQLEMRRHRLWLTETSNRSLSSSLSNTAADSPAQQREKQREKRRQLRRWSYFSNLEERGRKEVAQDLLMQESLRTLGLEKAVDAFLKAIRTPLTAADVLALLHHLHHYLIPLPPLPVPTSPDTFTVPLTSPPQAATLLPSIPVTPFSFHYISRYLSRISAQPPLIHHAYEDSSPPSPSSPNTSLPLLHIHLAGVRRDVMELIATHITTHLHTRGVHVQGLIRVTQEEEEGGGDRNSEGGEEEAAVLEAAKALEAGQAGWTIMDLGQVIIQTWSDEEVQHTAADHPHPHAAGKRELPAAEADRRLHDMRITRLSMLSRSA